MATYYAPLANQISILPVFLSFLMRALVVTSVIMATAVVLSIV